MSNEQVEQSSDGTQLKAVTSDTSPSSVTFPSGKVEDAQVEAEKTAFKTYIETSGEKVPDNFKDVDSWFSSLKEAQANYTRGQQEIAALKEQYAEQGPSPTTTNEEVKPEPVTVPEPIITSDSPELRVQKQVQEEVAAEAASIGVDQDTYDAWAMEMATTGEISNDTRETIKQRTGFSERMIDDYVTGQRARLRENFARAASTVGGQEKLQQIFDWASKNLSDDDQRVVNMGLASSSYEVTLRGLSSMYDQAVTSQKAAEPEQNAQLTQVSASETAITPYSTKREFTADRNNPKFNMEPRFRQMVEQRMSLTDWNHLPQ